jgi:hypothetical protein
MADIGEPVREHEITPLEEPLPREVPVEAPAEEPEQQPVPS